MERLIAAHRTTPVQQIAERAEPTKAGHLPHLTVAVCAEAPIDLTPCAEPVLAALVEAEPEQVAIPEVAATALQAAAQETKDDKT